MKKIRRVPVFWKTVYIPVYFSCVYSASLSVTLFISLSYFSPVSRSTQLCHVGTVLSVFGYLSVNLPFTLFLFWGPFAFKTPAACKNRFLRMKRTFSGQHPCKWPTRWQAGLEASARSSSTYMDPACSWRSTSGSEQTWLGHITGDRDVRRVQRPVAGQTIHWLS